MYRSSNYWILSASTVHSSGQERRVDFNLESLRVGQSVACSINKDGELHYYIDDDDKGVGWTGLPLDKPIWGFADIYGLARKIKSEFVFGEWGTEEPEVRGGEREAKIGKGEELLRGRYFIFLDELMSCSEDEEDGEVTG